MTRPDASRANGACSRPSHNAIGNTLVVTNVSQPLFDLLHAGYIERFDSLGEETRLALAEPAPPQLRPRRSPRPFETQKLQKEPEPRSSPF